MNFDLWKPLYVDDFSYDKYLYHYTNVETAIKIIYSNSLLFSPISRTNDTSESKMKIAFEQKGVTDKKKYKESRDKISNYFKEYSQYVQLLCFSMDAKISEKERKKYINSLGDKDIYFDVSGRGFSLPINGMITFLEGIVLGENMDLAYEKTIKMLGFYKAICFSFLITFLLPSI